MTKIKTLREILFRYKFSAGRLCQSNSDCESGECKKIYDENLTFCRKRCSPQVKSDDSMFFKDSKTPFVLVNDQYRDKLFSEEGAWRKYGRNVPVPTNLYHI